MTEPTYRCQFCGEDSPVSEWLNGGDTCPKCGQEYEPDFDIDDDEAPF